MARSGTAAISGSSYWPRSAVYVHGTAPLSRIHATATEVSRPPENAMPTRSPLGRVVRTLLMLGSCLVLLGEGQEASCDRLPALGVAGDDEDGVVAGDGAEHGVELGLVDGAGEELGGAGGRPQHD